MKFFNSVFIYIIFAAAVLSGIFFVFPNSASAAHDMSHNENMNSNTTLGPGLLRWNSLRVRNVPGCTVLTLRPGTIIEANSIEIEPCASISAVGMGAAGGAIGGADGADGGLNGGGSGDGGSGNRGGNGGGYGGDGGLGRANGFPVGASYDFNLRFRPTAIGSGGGGTTDSAGGAGGGSFKITVFGTLTVNGIITANGANGQTVAKGGGGGSGGSIWIIANTLAGTDPGRAIRANGGNGGGDSASARCGGGGGGGRIAIYYNISTFGAVPTASGGASGSGCTASAIGDPGSAGTVFQDGTTPTATVAAICGISQNSCTDAGKILVPEEAAVVSRLEGTATENDTETIAFQISIRNTTTNQWYNGAGAFVASETWFSPSITLPSSGTVSWSYDTTAVVWIVNNSYLVQARGSNPGYTQPTSQSRAFKMENLTTASGWAWSQNIGWISFSSVNHPGPIKYGVFVNKDTFVFSGYAWSENIGWITFNRSISGSPPQDYYSSGVGYIAKYDGITQQVLGWMRAISICPSLPCATGDNSEGFDGWIKLHRHPVVEASVPDYGVDYNIITEEFYGWAWGSKVIDWVSFNCANTGTCGAVSYSVKANLSFPPMAWNLLQTGNYVTSQNFEISPPYHQFSWEFFDPEDLGDLTSYQLQIDDNPSFTLTDPWDANISYTGPPTLASPISRQVQVVVDAAATPSNIGYNRTYYWRVQVFDSGGQSSGWTYPPSPFQASPDKVGPGTSFNTALHIYPTANFNFFPAEPSQGEEITFVESATCYDISGNLSGVPLADCTVPAGNYKWDFNYIGGVFTIDATGPTATNTYDLPGTNCVGGPGYCVAFEITDQNGLTTRVAISVSIKKPLPQFRERAPSGMLERLRAYSLALMAKIHGIL